MATIIYVASYIVVTEIQSTYIIVSFCPIMIVTTIVVPLPTSSIIIIIICLARHTTRTLRLSYRLSDILTS